MKDFIILIETSIILGCFISWLLGFEEWWHYFLSIIVFVAILLFIYFIILMLICFLAYRWYKKQDESLFSIIKKELRKYPLTKYIFDR